MKPRAELVAGVVHVHSDYSRDGLDSLERLRDVARERDIRFVALTDHAEDLTPLGWTAYVEHCRRVSDARVALIPGLEYRFAGYTGLHLLALGLTEWIAPATPEEFIATASRAARFTIVAHPVLARWRVPEAVSAGIDGIEVWNAAYNTRFLPDPRAIRLLQRVQRARPEVVATVGLDQHDARNDRETRILVAPGTDPLAEMKAGRFVNRGRTMTFNARADLGAARLAALSAARWAFDRIERSQDRLARALRSVSS